MRCDWGRGDRAYVRLTPTHAYGIRALTRAAPRCSWSSRSRSACSAASFCRQSLLPTEAVTADTGTIGAWAAAGAAAGTTAGGRAAGAAGCAAAGRGASTLATVAAAAAVTGIGGVGAAASWEYPGGVTASRSSTGHPCRFCLQWPIRSGSVLWSPMFFLFSRNLHKHQG